MLVKSILAVIGMVNAVTVQLTVFWLTITATHSYKMPYQQLLNGVDWKLTNENKSIVVLQADVPGSVHTALLKHGIINDPYYRMNDVQYSWISDSSWVYEKSFTVDQQLTTFSQVELVFEGIDTVAEVFLNGHSLGRSSNQFQSYNFSVKSFLQVSSNLLTMVISSPVKYALNQSQNYPYSVPPDCPAPGQHGQCHFNFIRKSACSFSWDWGPSFPTMGIWKNVTLRGYNSATITYVTAQTTPIVNSTGGTKWLIQGKVFFDIGQTNDNVSGVLQVGLSELSLYENLKITIKPSQSDVRYKLHIDEAKIELWMPNGMGGQRLYQLKASFTSTGGEKDWKMIRIGFRHIELVESPLAKGLTFYFRINGHPFFMKGSNWIPANSFQEVITVDYLRNLLTSAKEANMNVLRVWGGGVYESDDFYDLADELGILIWQDFMFACALYPTNEEFLNDVRAEVTHQIRRLQHHTSIAIWSGNNENEGALASDWFGIKKNYTRYHADYLKLYKDTIYRMVNQEDQSRPFIPSSPTNGKDTLQEGWVAKNPYDLHYGDVHHYDYTSDSWNYAVYPVSRFASEYGLQSWCSLSTLRPASTVVDWSLDSQFVLHRQHHGQGNDELKAEVSMHFNLPNSGNKTKDFVDFIYLTQVNQAVGIKTETELYRRMQSIISGDVGLTMGALYWQLNDIWQAPTWASLEYGGKWKMLHYYAKKFFNPFLISPVLVNNETVDYYYIHDLPLSNSTIGVMGESNQTLHSVASQSEGDEFLSMDERMLILKKSGTRHMRSSEKLTVVEEVYRWDSFKPTYTSTVEFDMPVAASAIVRTVPLVQLLASANCTSVNECIVHVSVPQHDTDNWLFLANFTDTVTLTRPTLTVTNITQTDSHTLSMDIQTDRPAAFVWLDADSIGGHFSDNGFMLFQPIKSVQFVATETISPESVSNFTQLLTVTSLMNIY